MPALLVQILVWFATGFIFRIFSSLGVGLVTYNVVMTIVNEYIAAATAAMYSLPTKVLGLIGLAGVDQAMTIIFSSIMAVAYLKTLSLGVSLLQGG
jgi:hypothetical protein